MKIVELRSLNAFFEICPCIHIHIPDCDSWVEFGGSQLGTIGDWLGYRVFFICVVRGILSK